MAIQQIIIRDTGYETNAGATTVSRQSYSNSSNEITLYYDDQSPAAPDKPVIGTTFYTDAAATTNLFNGEVVSSDGFWIRDAGWINSQGIRGWMILEISSVGVVVNAGGAGPEYLCDPNGVTALTIPTGTHGNQIIPNWGQHATPTVVSVNPATYTSGTSDYTVTFTVGPGWANTGATDGECIVDGVTVNPAPTQTPVPSPTQTPTPSDTTPPQITLTGANPITVELGSSYSDLGASALDDTDGDISASITTVGIAAVDTSTISSWTITYNVDDAAGNSATEVIRTVNVVDTTSPVITLIGDAIVNLTQGQPFTDPGATAVDNLDGSLTVIISGTPPPVDSQGNVTTIGTSIILYNVTDANSNAAVEVTRTVNVAIDAPPTAVDISEDVDYDSVKVITLVGSDDITNTGSLTYSISTAPTEGSVNLSGNVATYTHSGNNLNIDTFEFKVTDGQGQDSTPAVVTMNPQKSLPTADDATVGVDWQTSTDIQLTGSDNGLALTFHETVSPTKGTLQIDQTTGIATYVHTDSAATSTDQFKFKVTDVAGQDSTEATIDINITKDLPVNTNETIDIAWNATAVTITLVASISSNDNLTYTITSVPTKGTYQQLDNIITYTHTATLQGSDTFTFKTEDSAGQESVADGTITINPENSAPTITGPSSISLSQNSNKDIVVECSDPDGDNLLGIITGPSNGVLTEVVNSNTNQKTYKYTPTLGYSGADALTIKVTDNKGAYSSILNIAVTVTPAVEFSMNIGSFGDNTESLCLAPMSQTAYGKTADANNVAQLGIGDQIYVSYNDSTGFGSPFSSSGISTLIGVSDYSATSILDIDGSGSITSITQCTGIGESKKIDVKYADNTIAYCSADYVNIEIWYDSTNDPTQLTLEAAVNAGVNLFSSEYYSNLYHTNPNQSAGFVESGIYASIGSATSYYKRSTTNTWSLNSSSSKAWQCETDGALISFELGSIKVSDLVDPSINQFCCATKTEVPIWYVKQDVSGVSAFPNLISLAKANTLIYKSKTGAEEEDENDLFESNIFSDDTGYLAWENLGDGVNVKWYGYDNQQYLASGNDILSVGDCDNHIKPTTSINTINENNNTLNEVNVFYGFYSSTPEIEGPTEILDGERLFWPVHIIDGLHKAESSLGDSGSYIETFIDTLSFGDVIKTESFGSCLEYSFKIVAEDMDHAISLLKIELAGQTSTQSGNVRPIVSSGTDIGLGSESVVDVYSDTGANCFCVTNDTTLINRTYVFPVVDGYDTSRIEPNFNTQSNYKLDNIAKPLLRTNPKLSGNVKIVTTSDGSIYLESISATKDLAGIKYKKNIINPSGRYASDVAKFFKSTGTPSDLVYLTKRSESDLTVLESYNKQIEEDYQYGTTYNYSKNYTESYKMFAPIWADNNMPSNFIIFKVNSPSDKDNSAIDNESIIKEVLQNAEIVKSFDLSKESDLGKYIRTHVEQEGFPKSPITVSFGKNETTNFNGIDLKSGEITSKGEYIYKDFVQTDKPIIEANDFITDGFKRNNILCANLLNLEFLFDDDSSDDYSVNRYFGLYVDAIDSGNGEIDSITNNVIQFDKVTSIVDVDHPSTAIPSYTQMSSSLTLGYVKIDEIYYKISNSGLYDPKKLEVKVDDSTGNIPGTIGISYTGRSVNLTRNEERGFDFVKMSIIAKPETNDRIAVVSSKEESYKFTFIKHTNNEDIIIELDDSTGLKEFAFETGSTFVQTSLNMINNWNNLTDLNSYLNLSIDNATNSFVITENETNLGDLNMRVTGNVSSIIRVDQLQSNIEIQNRTYVANYTLDKGTFSNKFFSNNGSFSEIATSIAAAIHNDDSELDAYSLGSDIWVKTRIPGYKLLQHAVLVNKSNVIDFVKVNNLNYPNILKLRTGALTISDKWSAYYLTGGNSTSKSIFVDNITVSEISVGDYLETGTTGIYNKVIDIVEDITVANSDKSKLIVELKSDSETGEARVFNKTLVDIGLFSAYDVYDMNFDFYDTSNSDLKELGLEITSRIAYEPYDNAIEKFDDDGGFFDTALEANDIFNDGYASDPVDYFSNLSGILTEETVDKTATGNITSEFDRLKENELKEFAVNSRIVPNINKWVLKDSLTVRDQPYYLNTNEAFGRTNFAPDLTATGRNKDDMTHEWFYMDKKPKYLRYDELNDTFSYVNYIEGFELTPDLFKSNKNDYFDKFMITEGFEKNLDALDIDKINDKFGTFLGGYLNNDDINNTFFKTDLKKKYTLIDGGDNSSFASTIFKGLKVTLKNRKEFTNSTALDFAKTSEFNGYKFSILLKTNTDVNNNDVSFEVIQNKKFKFVIFFITLNISDYWIKDNMNRKLMYELNHKIIYDQGIEDYTYADTLFDGGLNWNGADLTGTSPFTINGINHLNGSVPAFDDQILLSENGLYGDVIMDLYPNTPGNTLYKFSIYSVEGSDIIKITSAPVNVNDDSDVLDIAYLPNYIQRNIKYYYTGGGTNIHKILLEKISINKVAEMLNTNDDSVTYTSVEEDGTINNNRFTINFQDGSEIIKNAMLSIEEDTDKPKSFKLFKGIIGYNLVSSEDPSYYPFLVRHNGSYTVDFKPVITFTDMYTHFKSNRLNGSADVRENKLESSLYKHSLTNAYELQTAKSYYERYNRCGTTFNLGFIQDNKVHDNDWGIIKNHFYHKVNETNPEGVTKLSESSDKLPLYPLIDEITISKKDINVFRSSWDAGYYTRSLTGGITEDVPGTLDNTEERSYFASTLMKIKDKYDIISFTHGSVEDQESLDNILRNGINKTEVVFFEDKKQITLDFYITDATTRLLKNDGVLSRIEKHVNPANSAGDKTTLSDDADFYINKNIIEQFTVDSVLLYTKRFKGAASSVIDTVDINLIGAGGFTPDNNFIFKAHKQKPMNFRLIYNKRLGYSYDIKPMIKIKS